MTHPAIRTCTCGHLEVDHARGRTSFPHPPQVGLCLRPDCTCKKFTEPPKRDAAWLEQAARRIADHEQAALDGLV